MVGELTALGPLVQQHAAVLAEQDEQELAAKKARQQAKAAGRRAAELEEERSRLLEEAGLIERERGQVRGHSARTHSTT